MADIINYGYPYVDYVLWTLIFGGLIVLLIWGNWGDDNNST